MPGQTLRDTTRASTAIRWGLGMGLVQQADEEGFWHWGDNGGFRSFAYVSCTRKQGFVYFTNSHNGASVFSALATCTLHQSEQPVADFLGYPTYRSPAVQVSRRLLTKGVVAAATPFLKTKSSRITSQLTEDDLLELADELTSSSQSVRAVELLALGTSRYPQSTKLLKNYGYACLQQGDYSKAASVLRRYVALNPSDESAHDLIQQLTTPAIGNVTLHLPAFPEAHCIALAGSFNNWQPLRTLFVKDGIGWRCTLQLLPGKYPYRIIVDGKWQTDPSNPLTEADGQGNANSILTVAKD
jgi:hypothetical protein